MTGYKDSLKDTNPETYRSIEKAFLPFKVLIARYFSAGYGPISLKVRFSNLTPGKSEPLVVTGKTGAGDFVMVKYLVINP